MKLIYATSSMTNVRFFFKISSRKAVQQETALLND